MGEPTILDKAFHVIMTRMVETGQAPFYTELARPLGLSVGESKKTLHDLFASGIPGWLYPQTDLIVSFAPIMKTVGESRAESKPAALPRNA